MRKLSKKIRGVKLPDYKHTSGMAAELMTIPEVVKISMSQHIGAPCTPIVQKGDYVTVGQLIGEPGQGLSAPIHSSVSGTVTSISTIRNITGGNDKVVVIEPDKEQVMFDGIQAPTASNRAEFIEVIKNSGLVGLGGAAFPTHVKFNPPNIDEVNTLILNGAECEPYITADHRLMLECSDDILEGIQLVMKYLDIKETFIGIEENKPDAIALLSKSINEKKLENIKVVPLKELYPRGSERVIVQEITGKELRAGVLPAQLGIIVSNVASIAFVGEYFRTGMPLICKRITVDGSSITNPKNLIVPIGASINDIIDYCGGFKEPPQKLIMGGPMMGQTLLSDEVPIKKNTNAVLAFNKKDSYISEETTCIHCGRCNKACPFHLVPAEIIKAYERKDIERMEELDIFECMECGSCSLVCPARKPLNFTHKIGKMLVKEAKANNGK